MNYSATRFPKSIQWLHTQVLIHLQFNLSIKEVGAHEMNEYLLLVIKRQGTVIK